MNFKTLIIESMKSLKFQFGIFKDTKQIFDFIDFKIMKISKLHLTLV